MDLLFLSKVIRTEVSLWLRHTFHRLKPIYTKRDKDDKMQELPLPSVWSQSRPGSCWLRELPP